MQNRSIIFGPIISRRLGSSLGVDLMPLKVCSLDCVYCECGKTTSLTNERSEYIPAKKIISDLDAYLTNNPPHIDVITLGGSGEPLLNSGVGKVISHIKTNYPQFKIAILTNSISLTEQEVRDEIISADYVLPSIDAFFEQSFQKINRPAKNVRVEDTLNGLREFAKDYKGIMWIEYFVIEGINDSKEEVEALRDFFLEINPTKVQLNSLDRAGTCSWVKATSNGRLLEIKDFMSKAGLDVDIISRGFNKKRVESREQTGKFLPE